MSDLTKDNLKIFTPYSLVLINKHMIKYTANDIEAMFNKYERQISHVVVAHTFHRPFIASVNKGKFKDIRADQYFKSKLVQTSKDTRHALNHFYKLLYPDHTNRPVRRPDLYKPLTFVTIEGAKETLDRSQTIHINLSLGNLPSVLTTEDIGTLFRHAWHDMAHQSKDVKAIEYYKVDGTSHWAGYKLKEAQQEAHKAWDTDSIWDVSNCWIPHAALKAD